MVVGANTSDGSTDAIRMVIGANTSDGSPAATRALGIELTSLTDPNQATAFLDPFYGITN